MKRVDEINTIFKEASALKDKARTSIENTEFYDPASKMFAKAAKLAESIAEREKSDMNLATQCRVISLYYHYESNSCHAMYLYGNGLLNEAATFGTIANNYINRAIQTAQSERNRVGDKMRHYLDARIIEWNMAEQMSTAVQIGIDARSSLNSKDIISALDKYRDLISRFKEILDYSINNKLPAEEQRIAAGNLCGAMANAANATAFLALADMKPGDEKSIPKSAFIQFVRNSLEAHQMAKEAFASNPQWQQYLHGSDSHIENINTLLNNYKSLWPDIYVEFGDNSTVIRMMKTIDSTELERISGNANANKDDCDPLLLGRLLRRGLGFWVLWSIIYSLTALGFRNLVVISMGMHVLNILIILLLTLISTTQCEWRKRWLWKSAYPITIFAILCSITISIATIPNSIRLVHRPAGNLADQQVVPDIEVRIRNSGRTIVAIQPRGDFLLWLPETMGSGAPRISGKYDLLRIGGGNRIGNAITVIPNAEIRLHLRMMNKKAFTAILERGDTDMDVIFRRQDGSVFFSDHVLPFTKEDIRKYYIPANAKQK